MSDETTTAPDVETPELTIGGRKVTLRVPTSASERWDYLTAVQSLTPSRAMAAALGLCWPWLRSQLPPYRGDLAALGGQVVDLMVGKGVAMTEVLSVGRAANSMLLKDIPGSALPNNAEETQELLGN